MFRDKKKIQLCLLKGEIDLREELVETLLDGGFGVNGFSAARELHAALPVVPCDIVIIDTELPGEDCFSIAARLRSLGNVGIIILSARSETEDRVRALQGGADVYLTKPVDLRELVAVVTSLARRLERSEPKSIRKTEVTPSVWSLSAGGWSVIAPNTTCLPLTAQERAFMMRLWECAGEAVSREDLVVALGGDPYEYDFHRLDTLVSRLRRKATDIDLALPLRSVRGMGYVIVPTSELTFD